MCGDTGEEELHSKFGYTVFPKYALVWLGLPWAFAKPGGVGEGKGNYTISKISNDGLMELWGGRADMSAEFLGCNGSNFPFLPPFASL